MQITKYTLLDYVDDLCFEDKEGKSVKYAKAIFIKETNNGRSLEIFKASKGIDAYGYVGTECTPLFNERGQVVAFA